MKRGKNTGYTTSTSSSGILDRRRHFIEALKNLKNSTKQKICDYLEERGDLISDATFYRVRNELQDQMGIQIEFDQYRGYHIAEGSEKAATNFLEMTGISLQDGQLQSSLMAHPELYEYVLMDEYPKVDSAKALHTILEAIRTKRMIKIHYVKFFGQGERDYHNLEPHYVKKYLGRWYVFAYAPWLERPMTLAIDQRMEKVELQEEIFERKEKEFEWVKELIGLNTAQAEADFGITEPIPIDFEVGKWHADYTKALPMHPSQISLGPGEEEGSERFRLLVLPNYELVQAFYRMGDQVKIISPDFFVEYFKRCVEGIRGRY